MTKTNHFSIAVAILAAALSAILLTLVTGAKPAEAAFPGANGKIFFERQVTDVFALSASGTETKLVEGSNPAVSPDGSRIAYVNSKNIWMINANGTGNRQLTTDSKFNDHPAWSPDGTKIAFSAGSPTAFDEADIFVMNADGSGKKNLTNTASDLSETDPAWSPDGQKIAYTRSTCDPNGFGGSNCVFVMNADGTNQTNLTPEETLPQCPNQPGFRHKGASEDPGWSPDGQKIAFEGTTICPNGSGTDVWIMNADGSNKTVVNGDDGTADRQPVFSPDGNELAFTSDGDNSSSVQKLYKVSLSTFSLTKLTTGEAFSPDWQPLPQCTKTVNANNDPLLGTAGKDVLCGDSRANTINGAGGDDILLAGGGNDRLTGSLGNDTLNGSAGVDTSLYPGSTSVRANLTTGFATGVGSDALLGIENLSGSGANDQLTGSSVANMLVGGKGADRLYGFSGADTLNSRDGVNGNDTLDGGSGTDRCIKDATEKSVKSCP
jgi:Ca2+-binding RTX toxin-like protein